MEKSVIIRVSMEAAATETGVKQAACPSAARKHSPAMGIDCVDGDIIDDGDGFKSSFAAQLYAGYAVAQPRHSRTRMH